MNITSMGMVLQLLLTLVSVGMSLVGGKHYEPNWESIDSRPLPAWYDEAKVGIFIHWGVFSVPSLEDWFWWHWKSPAPLPSVVKFMEKNYPPDWTYADFARQFDTPTGIYNPDHWAELFNASGARYVVQVTKHHEGFTSWPSKYSFNWNAMDVGPHRDLVGDLATAVRKYPNLKFGVYHSLFEWFNPLYRLDERNYFKTQYFVTRKTMPELYELVTKYKPEIIWSDGGKGPAEYWNSTGFLAWLYNDSPVKDTVVTNDRWGNGVYCHHGGYYTCLDRYNPGILEKHKYENAMTLDKHSWGYRRNMKLKDVLTIEELLSTLVTTISCNGNILINVGPTKDGSMPVIFEERLRQLGSWLAVNGEAVYGTRPWTFQNDTVAPKVWYTQKKMQKSSSGLVSTTTVFAFTLQWPGPRLWLAAPAISRDTTVKMLGMKGQPLNFTASKPQGVLIDIPTLPYSKLPCHWVWVLKITNVQN